MATLISYIAAILPRLLFVAHSIVALWLLVSFNPGQTIFWGFCVGLVCLFVESIYTIIVRKGVEYKYFWPSCFFYLCTLLPITWSAELTLLEGRVNNVTDEKMMIVSMAQTFYFGQEELKKFCEIGLMLIIILGRWILPRGVITRDQLSILLLEYAAIAADILELFEAFEDDQVARNKDITLATLAVFSWSLFQFTLVTTSMGKKTDDQEDNLDHNGNDLRVEDGLSRKYLRKAAHAKKRESRRKRRETYELYNEDDEMRKLELQGDRYGIIAAMFIQDGPFLILRLYLVFKYDFLNDSKFSFYIGKNFISLLLMIYRLYVIHFHAKEEEFTLPRKKSFRSLSFMLIGVQRFRSRKSTRGNKADPRSKRLRQLQWIHRVYSVNNNC